MKAESCFLMISKVFYTFVYSIVKNMSKKTILVYIGIGCLLAVLAMWSFRSTERRMLEVAEHTFVDAVHQDLDERWKGLGETYSFHFGTEKERYHNLTILSDDDKQSISLENMNYTHNVDSDMNRRLFHTILCDMSLACHPDSLVSIWQSLLSKEGLKTSGNVVVLDFGQNVSMLKDSLSIDSSFDSLPVYYAGVANELQLNGLVRLSVLDVFRYQPLLSLYVCLLMAWIVFMAWKIPSKTKTLIIPDKEGFRLSQDVVYDSDARCFIKEDRKIILSPKGNLIIKALLEAENHQLHGADLLVKVWDSDETSMNKLYIQNSKLRNILKELGDGFDIVSMDRSHFRFVFPYSCINHNELKT